MLHYVEIVSKVNQLSAKKIIQHDAGVVIYLDAPINVGVEYT